MGQRQKYRLVTEMPFTKATGYVSLFLEQFRDCNLFWVQPALFTGENHATIHPYAVGVGTGHESRAGRRAGGVGDLKLGQLEPFLRHPVEVRCLVHLIAEGTNVPIAHVVNEDEDDVGLIGRLNRKCNERKYGKYGYGGGYGYGEDGSEEESKAKQKKTDKVGKDG